MAKVKKEWDMILDANLVWSWISPEFINFHQSSLIFPNQLLRIYVQLWAPGVLGSAFPNPTCGRMTEIVTWWSFNMETYSGDIMEIHGDDVIDGDAAKEHTSSGLSSKKPAASCWWTAISSDISGIVASLGFTCLGGSIPTNADYLFWLWQSMVIRQ